VPGPPRGWPDSAWRPLEAAGLDALGALAPDRYDALVPDGWRIAVQLPGAAVALVIGSGGHRLARKALAAGGRDPVERLTSIAVARCVDALRAEGRAARALHAFERRDATGEPSSGAGAFADFVALGREAGLGAPSRLRVLVHPVYGPWLAIRSVVLTTAPVEPTPPLAGFAPCDGCPAPCQAACPANALEAGPLDWPRCRDERLAGGDCATRCAARHACVVGRAHAHAPDVEAHFMGSSLRIAAESLARAQVDPPTADGVRRPAGRLERNR